MSSATVKTLRLLGFSDRVVNDILVDDSMLTSDAFWELNSDPDFLISRSVNVEVEERPEVDFAVFDSPFLSPFENEKHFIAPKIPIYTADQSHGMTDSKTIMIDKNLYLALY